MEARFSIENPDEIEATLKMTMPIGNWIRLKDQLENKWPSSDLNRTIAGLLLQVTQTFYPDKIEETKNKGGLWWKNYL